jgi:hypothetical protein
MVKTGKLQKQLGIYLKTPRPLKIVVDKVLNPVHTTKIWFSLFVAAALISIGQITACILFLILFTFYAYFNSKLLLIAIYVIFFPTDGVFIKEYNLLGYINVNIMINILTTIKLLPSIRTEIKLSKLQILSIQMVIIISVILIYVEWKGVVFSLTELDSAINRTIYHLFKYLPLILIIRIVKHKYISMTVISAIKLTSFILILSALLAPYLIDTGLKISIEDLEITQIPRYRGLYAEGDVNSFGIYCSMIIGFILAFNRSNLVLHAKTNLSLIVLSIAGIAISGSRAAIITLIIVMMMFAIYNMKRLSLLKYLLLFGVLFTVFYPSIIRIQDRFDDFSAQVDKHNLSGRVGKWYAYINHINDHPAIFVFGNKDLYYLTSRDELRAAHNYYIETVYQAGIIPFLFIMVIYVKMFLLFIKHRYDYQPLLYVLPVIIGSMTVSAIPGVGFMLLLVSGNSVMSREVENDAFRK